MNTPTLAEIMERLDALETKLASLTPGSELSVESEAALVLARGGDLESYLRQKAGGPRKPRQ